MDGGCRGRLAAWVIQRPRRWSIQKDQQPAGLVLPPVSRVTAYSSSLRSRCYELRENCGRRSEGIVGVSGPKKKSPDKLRLRGLWMQLTEAPAFCRIGRKAHTSSAGETSFMVLQRGFDRLKRNGSEFWSGIECLLEHPG